MSSISQTIAYKRISTLLQSTERQLIGMKFDKIFTDTLSGKSRERKELQSCLEYIREGDTLYVHSIDRLARSFRDLLDLVDLIVKKKKVELRFHSENLVFSPDSSNPANDFLFHVMGAVAEFERKLLLERQAEGIKIAKAAGKYKGRVPALKPDQVEKIRHSISSDGVGIATIAREYGVSRPVIYRIVKRLRPYAD